MQAHRLAANGPRVVFDEIGYGDETGKLGTHIFLADLSRQTLVTLATTGNGDAAWMPDITDNAAAWSEWHSDPSGSGALSWRVFVQRLDTGERTVIASGVNRRLEGTSAVPPLVQIDGDMVAYTVEDPAPGREWGWQIIVASATSGTIAHRYPTAFSVYQMTLEGNTVLYTEGLVDEKQSFKYAMRLMVARSTSSTALADDAFEVALSDGRAAWISDPDSSRNRLGMAQHPQLMTSSGFGSGMLVSREPGFQGAFWPSTADGIVAWSEDEGGSDGTAANRLALWSQAHGTVLVDHAHTPLPLLGGHGWLLWYDDSAQGINAVLHGTTLDALAYPS